MRIPEGGPNVFPLSVDRVNRIPSVAPEEKARQATYTFPFPDPAKLSTVFHSLSCSPVMPGAQFTGGIQVPPSLSERNIWRPVPENASVDRYTRPVVVFRERHGSPASPLESNGRVPPSVHDEPPSAEVEKPVNLCAPARNEPESLNPEMTFEPDPRTSAVSLCVSCAVASAAALLTRLLGRAVIASRNPLPFTISPAGAVPKASPTPPPVDPPGEMRFPFPLRRSFGPNFAISRFCAAPDSLTNWASSAQRR